MLTGVHQHDTSINMEQDAVKELNQLLRAAGCTNLININFIPTCKIVSDSEVCQWNKLLPLHAEYIEAGLPWQDMILDLDAAWYISEVNTGDFGFDMLHLPYPPAPSAKFYFPRQDLL